MNIFSYFLKVFLNEEFLKKNKISYEIVKQEPGEFVFVESHSLHQVFNDGYGLNVAWNLCPFTFEMIKSLANGYLNDIQYKKAC